MAKYKPFQPFAWQVNPWRDINPVMLLTGSAGGGKSQLAAEKVHAFLDKYPGSCGVAVRKARVYATHSIVPMMKSVVQYPDIYNKSDLTFTYPNGSILYIGGMKDDEQREAIRSVRGEKGDPDIIWMEEANAFSRQDFDELGARLRGNAAGWTQLLLSTNPDIPQHWIYNDLILGGQAHVYYSNAHDNPRNTQAYFTRLDNLVGVLRDRLRDGKWVRAEGAVYDEFDPNIHLIDAFPIPREWRRIRVVDFGYTNPFVCQWWAIDPDGRMYLYREIYVTKRLVEELTEEILEYEGNISTTIADHDAEDRATMNKHGIPTVAAKKEVLRGIQTVKSRLKVQGDGKPRLYIMRGAIVDPDPELDGMPQGAEGEITAYSWDKYVDGKPNKEQPVKMFDHSMDSMRYAAVFLDGYTPLPSQEGQRSKWLPASDQLVLAGDRDEAEPDAEHEYDDDEKPRKNWTRSY